MGDSRQQTEVWGSRLGVILAVAGSAVGLGNFLRFPGLAAQYGGGPFMIAYFTALLLIGIPVSWVEWSLGRQGGARGYHSTPGIFHALIGKPWAKYLGLLGALVPVGIYCYYVLIESWCLGYAWQAVSGGFSAKGFDYGAFFATFTGVKSDGAGLHFGLGSIGPWLLAVMVINFVLIYRGISRGIEKVCIYAMPVLVVIGVVIVVRVLTLGTPDAAKPDQSVINGLGRMWNPGDWSRLADPQLWLAAAGQIFFTLSVGVGAIINFASYLKPNDDVVLSSTTAAAANEFCEVGLGGLMTVPAAYVFFGAAAIGGGTFGLAFQVLPNVFAHMAYGQVFATLFFTLLFLAALTSSLSMLQPGIAFLEEGLGLQRRSSVALLGFVTSVGTVIVWWFSGDLKALDTFDFWVGTVALFLNGTILVIVFSWILGVEPGWVEAHRGAELRIPGIFKPLLRYVTPTVLLLIFATFVLKNAFGWNLSFTAPVFAPSGYITDLIGPKASGSARVTVLFMLMVAAYGTLLVTLAGERWTSTAAHKEKAKS
jgi:NSS family neurotransmitter:Na+ symporter